MQNHMTATPETFTRASRCVATAWLRHHSRRRWLSFIEQRGPLVSLAGRETDRARFRETVQRLRDELDRERSELTRIEAEAA